MALLNWSRRDEVTKPARPRLLYPMRNHSPGESTALFGVVDTHPRLNPHDDEVRELLVGTDDRVGA